MSDIGGQAVIEGVMMKSDKHMTVAVRLPNKKTTKTKGLRGAELGSSIKTKKQKLKKLKKFWTIPFIRGIVQLIYILILGIKALIWSSDQQLGKDEKITAKELAITLVISFGFAVLFFVIAPFFITKAFVEKGLLFNIIDGILRLVIFLVYVAVIALFNDVKILFQYHGAEHKCINCYERKKPLTIKNIKKYSTLHPRCGTAFILIVLIVSIFIFSLITGSWQIRLISRIILIPVIAGISYELLKLSARFKHNFIIQAITYPGLLLQKLTTREPNNKQIEVALVSLKELLKMEKQ